ncbi:MAG TPA: vWA domain-containing protein [Bacteroidia bacterium]
MKPLKVLIALLFLSSISLKAQPEPAPLNVTPIQVVKPGENIIQLALLLDVSGSMDGLISQAQSELWNIVNEVAKAKKSNTNAKLEIALYEYGRSTADKSKGYVTKLLDYTSDLDTISTVLFSLTTNGGEEYCGQAIANAMQELQWRDNPNIYRVIFIAGNEPFNQGNEKYSNSCKNAKEKGIFINTIHCGDSLTGVREFWADGAAIGNGSYFFINQNSVKEIATPYDSLLGTMGQTFNTTYWGFGNNASFYVSNQTIQDKNANSKGKSAGVARIAAKTTSVYSNTKWDVVDAFQADSTWLEKTKEEELPEKMRGLTIDEKKTMIDSLTKSRNDIKNEIARLNKLRLEYIAANTPKSAEKTLGMALIEAIHRQAGMKGFVFN